MIGEIFHIELRADEPSKNIRRFYHINVGRDLLGDLVVTLRNGRIGNFGREKCHIVKDEEEAKKLVLESLKKRKSAPKRIGVSYEVNNLTDPHNWMEY